MAKIWKRLLPQIGTDAFPKRLPTRLEGILELDLNFLIAKDEELEFVSGNRLLPGSDIKARFVRYVFNPEQESDMSVTLHPPERGRANPKSWVELFERRFATLNTGWKELLVSQPDKITKLLRSYGEVSLEGEEFVRGLSVSNLKISVASDDEFVFDPASPFESLNLNVVVSHSNRVKEAHFDG